MSAGTASLRRQSGFILATSLVFLVVLTLLAVTAISSATLQQRMSANQSDKAALLESANSTLSYVGTLLGSAGFLTCFQAKLVDTQAAQGVCDPALKALLLRISDDTELPAAQYLAEPFWAAGPTNTYQPIGASGPPVQYVVEYLNQSPIDSNSKARRRRFRVTARARQAGSGTRSVSQMIYEVVQ